jgi:lipopolysaccharide transport system permease protein
MAETQEKWTTEIRPKDSLLSVDFKEIWRYRDLMMLFVKRNIIALSACTG